MAGANKLSAREVRDEFGASVKGFGAAGITVETELARTRAVLAAAQAAGTTVIGVHIGGAERRGCLSEQFIELVS